MHRAATTECKKLAPPCSIPGYMNIQNWNIHPVLGGIIARRNNNSQPGWNHCICLKSVRLNVLKLHRCENLCTHLGSLKKYNTCIIHCYIPMSDEKNRLLIILLVNVKINFPGCSLILWYKHRQRVLIILSCESVLLLANFFLLAILLFLVPAVFLPYLYLYGAILFSGCFLLRFKINFIINYLKVLRLSLVVFQQLK